MVSQQLPTAGTQLATFMIVGLGNPGREYQGNRHNIGFRLLNYLSERLGVTFSRLESKSLVTKADYHGHRLILVKPQTYMNLSGQAVESLVRFYKIPLEQVMVVFDDVDLPFGALRLRHAGGSGGQKGMQSIIDRLGTQDIPRLRMGIDRPPGRMEAADYVLQDFSKSETELLPGILARAADALLTYIREGLEAAMNQFNSPGMGDQG